VVNKWIGGGGYHHPLISTLCPASLWQRSGCRKNAPTTGGSGLLQPPCPTRCQSPIAFPARGPTARAGVERRTVVPVSCWCLLSSAAPPSGHQAASVPPACWRGSGQGAWLCPPASSPECPKGVKSSSKGTTSRKWSSALCYCTRNGS
jgi:hypothetical protein